jgi:protein-S-isoprenylcysteine O-methyltransferase Ste14
MSKRAIETMGYFINGLSIPFLFYFMFNLDAPDSLRVLAYVGWIMLGVGVALIVLSTATLVNNRGEGLIDRGVFGLVRHPMYLGGMLCFVSFFFFLPHWVIFALSAVNVAVVYYFVLEGDQQNITKFGNAYRRYMDSVPRINLLTGILRRLQTR